MYYIDTPWVIFFRGKHRRHAHCVADSLQELHDTMQALGVPRRAFHDKPGQPHYDIFEPYIDYLLANGARQVSRRELLLLSKRMIINPEQPINEERPE